MYEIFKMEYDWGWIDLETLKTQVNGISFTASDFEKITGKKYESDDDNAQAQSVAQPQA